MQAISNFTAELVRGNPRSTADTTLQHVIGRHAAAGGAVISLRGDRLVPFVSRNVDYEDGYRRAAQLWSENAAILRGGETVASHNAVIVPLADPETSTLIGLLFLDAPEVIGVEGAEMFTLFLYHSLRADEEATATNAAAAPVVQIFKSEREREREEMLLLLNRNEWNIARVARILGVTRRTIYLRLIKYKVERRKVPKVTRTAESES